MAIALFAAAGPAEAADAIAGSGAGTGYSDIDVTGNPQADLPPCLPGSANSKYVVNVPAGVVRTSTQQYVGALTVTITITESFFFSPAGIFDDEDCILALPQAATLAVSSSGTPVSGTSVSCTPADDGKFSRVNTTLLFEEPAADLASLDGSCTVNGVAVGPVTHTFAGNEYPCLEDPFQTVYTCPAGIDNVHVQGDWTAVGGG